MSAAMAARLWPLPASDPKAVRAAALQFRDRPSAFPHVSFSCIQGRKIDILKSSTLLSLLAAVWQSPSAPPAAAALIPPARHDHNPGITVPT